MPSNPNAPMQPLASLSYMRFLHASPDAPPVDVYANGQLLARDLAYKQLTGYLSFAPGIYTVQVFPAGQRTNPVISRRITIPPESAFTAAATGTLANIGPTLIPDVYNPEFPMPQNSYVRFVHLSPNAPAVDIALPDGTVLFRNVPYKSYTQYAMVNPGTYTILVKPTGSSQTVLAVPNVKLQPGTLNTVYAVGLVGQQPPLEAITSMDAVYM